MPKTLVLASTSPFRRSILEKLGYPFETFAPEVDESRHADEDADTLVARLAEAKARAATGHFHDALVIGSDQVAVIDGRILGKPHEHERAMEQLRAASGRRVTFKTGLCLFNTATDQAETIVAPFDVQFRVLSDAEIDAYLRREEPYNAAGSFKSEALGITLFEGLYGDDPNTLIGLPLIQLNRMLRAQGLNVLLDS
ncbi:MAG: Maf family protein [Gammaproteobacteria bacterium]